MSDLDLLAAYRATIWTVELPGGLAQLRLDESAPLHPRPLGIITAYNPASAPCLGEENRAANEELRRELERAGALLYCAVAHGTGEEAEKWTESGFAAVGVELPLLVALGERFGQNAIVWVDDAGQPALVVTRAGFCGASVGEILPTPRPE